jgi:glycosyltransferase involved in cell wall biosynthesis
MSERKMKVLYIHRTRARDGQSIHIDELITAFRAQGHAVRMVGPRRIHALSNGIERKLLPRSLYELAELAYSLIEFFRLWLAGRQQKPDLIYQRANLHMLGAVWAARLLRVPLVLEVNAPLARERGAAQGFAWPALARWSERFLWRHADIVLPVTEVLAQEVEAAGVPRKRIAVIANGVNPDRFRNLDRRRAKQVLGLDGKLVLGFTGYVRPWHGLEQVIDLLADEPALQDAHLIVVGDGPARATLTAQAASRGVDRRVFFTGVVAHEDVARLASAFDIALQPDVTRYASPLKIFEYMALGHAIVAPDTANIREVLRHGESAVMFTPGNYAAFAQAVTQLAQDSALRAQLGKAVACNIVTEDRTWEANARRIVALLPATRSSAGTVPVWTKPGPEFG